MYRFIRKHVRAGRQVYIVCSLVGAPDTIPNEKKTVTEYTSRLQTEIFPDLPGRLRTWEDEIFEKERIMAAFAAGTLDILVSTTVIEVGVDVPNATIMVVENAEQFGLSQLHQLRGRVGRGTEKSYCILFSDTRSENTKTRLRAMTKPTTGSESPSRIWNCAALATFFRAATARPAQFESSGPSLRPGTAAYRLPCCRRTARRRP